MSLALDEKNKEEISRLLVVVALKLKFWLESSE